VSSHHRASPTTRAELQRRGERRSRSTIAALLAVRAACVALAAQTAAALIPAASAAEKPTPAVFLSSRQNDRIFQPNAGGCDGAC
jgi:hypothetical protein